MTRVKRGGRELVVPDTEVAAYLSEGYAVIDDQGNVLTKAKAMTFSQLKAEHDTLKLQLEGALAQAEQYKQEIADRDARIAEMEAKFAEMEAQIASLSQPKAETTGKQAYNTQTPGKAAPATKSPTGGKTAQKG